MSPCGPKYSYSIFCNRLGTNEDVFVLGYPATSCSVAILTVPCTVWSPTQHNSDVCTWHLATLSAAWQMALHVPGASHLLYQYVKCEFPHFFVENLALTCCIEVTMCTICHNIKKYCPLSHSVFICIYHMISTGDISYFPKRHWMLCLPKGCGRCCPWVSRWSCIDCTV